MIPRIYADANSCDEEGRYSLFITGSLVDIEKYGDKLQPGMRVLLNVQHEYEVEATLEYDQNDRVWYGRPDDSTIRYL